MKHATIAAANQPIFEFIDGGMDLTTPPPFLTKSSGAVFVGSPRN